jgi:hypothetical protein
MNLKLKPNTITSIISRDERNVITFILLSTPVRLRASSTKYLSSKVILEEIKQSKAIILTGHEGT